MTEKSKSESGTNPLVAIGASAGGLAPLEDFFKAAPQHSGWTFVVLQHLSPDYRSVMDELLGRKTGLAIRHVVEGEALLPDTIYLNTPQTLVQVRDNRFILEDYEKTDEIPRHPIDAFFTSMSKVARERKCAAVILSGSGADGSRGAQAVHAAGGSVLVQSPKSAKFASMPHAVLASGAVDRVAEAADLPGLIADLFAVTPASERPDGGDPMKKILRMLETRHHIDFSLYKTPTVIRRIERRQELRGFETTDAFADLLAADPASLDELYHDMLIGVTEFYRDPDAVASLVDRGLRQIVEESSAEAEIRVWICACATGEEAYTIAIELAEMLREYGREDRFRVIATDVHKQSIRRAATGIYSLESLDKVPKDRRERYFSPHPEGMIVESSLRQNMIFSVHDALSDPPFMDLDLISCRNLLIYLDTPAQQRLLSLFLFGLRKGGVLYLGKSESHGGLEQDFEALDQKMRLYQKRTGKRVFDPSLLSVPINSESRRRDDGDSRARRRHLRPPLPDFEAGTTAAPDRMGLFRGYDALLKRYAPSSILIRDDGQVITWFGAASAYIDTISDLAERKMDQIVHPSLQYVITLGIEKTAKSSERTFERVTRIEDDTGTHEVSVSIEPLSGLPDQNRYLLVRLDRLSAEEAAPDEQGRAVPRDAPEDHDFLLRRIRELERDLRLTDESLQYVTERLEASGEELQASNEELHASNEELQAANEELQASNEELQAVNEQLTSVSEEHERKIGLLSELNEDFEGVFERIGLGLVILDRGFVLRRFTRKVAVALGLVEADLGRSLLQVGEKPAALDIEALIAAVQENGGTADVKVAWRGKDVEIRAFSIEHASRRAQNFVIVFEGL